MNRTSSIIGSLTIFFVFFALISCKKSGSSSAHIDLPQTGAYLESAFFSEFSFEPIPVDAETGQSTVPWVAETTDGPSGGTIAPLLHYPEREYYYVFTHVGDGAIPSLDDFWTMIIAAFGDSSSPEIKWNHYDDTPCFAYGSYPAAKGMIGRIWIELAPSPTRHKIEFHLRMIEQPDNL